jgi:hypothetical protein
LVLPTELRQRYGAVLKELLYRYGNNPYWQEHERNHLQRLIDYLDVVKTPHSDAFDMPKLLNDFREFYTQYDQRRHKSFAVAFPEFEEWYNQL